MNLLSIILNIYVTNKPFSTNVAFVIVEWLIIAASCLIIRIAFGKDEWLDFWNGSED